MSSQPLRALVVDDEKFLRQILGKMLVRLGVDVVGSAENGEQAIDLYKQLKPDVVLLDIAMPVKDGLQAAREILHHDENACILMCTSFQSKRYIVEAVKLGARGYLTKPFDLRSIREKLQKICQVDILGRSELGESTLGNTLS